MARRHAVRPPGTTDKARSLATTVEGHGPAGRTSLPSEDPSGRSFRGDIQGLRAVAVGLVLLYHLWPQRLKGGFVGVDVFFVISGFLITTHLVPHPPRTRATWRGSGLDACDGCCLPPCWCWRRPRGVPARRPVDRVGAHRPTGRVGAVRRELEARRQPSTTWPRRTLRRSSTTGRCRSRSSSTWLADSRARAWRSREPSAPPRLRSSVFAAGLGGASVSPDR